MHHQTINNSNMEELKTFITDILNRVGLGVEGNINSYNIETAQNLFTDYNIEIDGNIVRFSKDGKNILSIIYTTNDKGVIKNIKIQQA